MKFSDILSPTTEDDFFKNYLGVKPLINKTNKKNFSYLLDWENINRIILEHRLEHPRLRMFKNLDLIPATNYINKTTSRRGSSNPTISIREFNSEILNGATLIIDAVQELHAPIRNLCQEFDVSLNGNCQANTYIALADQQAFDTHWDGHDVFVLQLTGSKKWKIYYPTRPYPLDTDLDLPSLFDKDIDKKLFWEGVLDAGEMLYIPRGWWHSVSPIGKETVHLSIGYNPPTGIDFIKWISKRFHAHELMRAPSPLFGDNNSKQKYIDEFKDVINKYLNVESFEQHLLDRIGTQTPRMIPALPFSADPTCKELSPSINVIVANKNSILKEENESFFIISSNKKYEIDKKYYHITNIIFSQENFISVKDIIDLSTHSSDITHLYIIHLLRLGVLRLAS